MPVVLPELADLLMVVLKKLVDTIGKGADQLGKPSRSVCCLFSGVWMHEVNCTYALQMGP